MTLINFVFFLCKNLMLILVNTLNISQLLPLFNFDHLKIANCSLSFTLWGYFGKALCIRSCHENLILTIKSWDCIIQWQTSMAYKEIHRELISQSNLLNEISLNKTSMKHIVDTSAIRRVVCDELVMSFNKLTKCHPEKFTPANISYCKAYLNYMLTVLICNLKFYDEVRINVAMTIQFMVIPKKGKTDCRNCERMERGKLNTDTSV